jgi:hypothetical protein
VADELAGCTRCVVSILCAVQTVFTRITDRLDNALCGVAVCVCAHAVHHPLQQCGPEQDGRGIQYNCWVSDSAGSRSMAWPGPNRNDVAGAKLYCKPTIKQQSGWGQTVH